MKLRGFKSGFSAGGPPSAPSGGGGFSRGFTAASKPTVHPAMASQPGMYGGPPGSFIVPGACPPGYSRSAMHRGPGQPQQYRCIPRVAAPAAPRPAPAPAAPPVTVEVSPAIDVSPAIQTQVSPQISPVMTMQQDSPGAAVSAAPQQTGAPQTAATGPSAPSGEAETTERLRKQLEEERTAREQQHTENLMRMFEFLARPQQPAPVPQAPQAPAPPAPEPRPAPMPEPRVIQTLAPTQRDTSFLDRQAQPMPVAPRESGLNMGLVLLAVAAGIFLLKPKGGKNESRKSA